MTPLVPLFVSLGNKRQELIIEFEDGGEGGIRTLDTLPYTHFPGVLLQPLGHLTKLCVETGNFNKAANIRRYRNSVNRNQAVSYQVLNFYHPFQPKRLITL